MVSVDELIKLGDPDDIRRELSQLRASLAARDAEIERLRAANEHWHERVRLFKLEEQEHSVDMESIYQLCIGHIAKGSDAQDFETTVGVVENAIGALVASIAELRERNRDLEARKDGAYLERNRVVAALARCFSFSGTARTAIEGWSEDWHGCVYIDIPFVGQVSWHFHDTQAWLFEDLPPYQGGWDGHDTDEKYRRLEMFCGIESAVASDRAQGERGEG
jgi:hypothetical protein